MDETACSDWLPSTVEQTTCAVSCPADCVMSPWSEWTTCVQGIRRRTRYVVGLPAAGGAPCPPEAIQEQPCSEQPVQHQPVFSWWTFPWTQCALPDYRLCGSGTMQVCINNMNSILICINSIIFDEISGKWSARKTTRSTWTISGAGCCRNRKRCAPVASRARKTAAYPTGPSGASAPTTPKKTSSSRASASSCNRPCTKDRPARPSSKNDPVSTGWPSRIASAGTCHRGRPVSCRPPPNAEPESPSEVNHPHSSEIVFF